MSGEKESLTIEQRYEKIDEMLSQYESALGIPKTFKINTEEVMGYLQMTRDELRALDEEQCAEISFALNQAAFYIQKERNKETAKLNWADAQINGMIAPFVGGLKGYSYEERKNQAIRNDSACMKLQQLKVNAKQRTDRLDGLSNQLQYMSKSLNDLKFVKRGNQNG